MSFTTYSSDYFGLLKEERIILNPTNGNDNHDNRSRDKRQAASTLLYDLSEQMIQTTISYFMPYYIVGHRHDFALCFSGATWHTKISEDSAVKILSEIAAGTNDEEIESRLNTLRATYEKTINGEPITGGPTLADLISTIKDCESEEAREIIASIHSMWYNDIQRQRKQTSDTSGQGEQEQIKTVRDAMRVHNENVNVRGGHALICNACNLLSSLLSSV